MKTAISLPDALYADAEAMARAMGIPRSQLFAKALEEFISRRKKERLTEKLNQVYATIGADPAPPPSTAGLEALRELTKHDSW